MKYRPIELSPNNFTPLTRAPWGGTRLCASFKRSLGLPAGTRVGESWELSVGPELPSTTASGEPLANLISRDPHSMLGQEAELGRSLTALLLKWIDTDANLSLQIHPPNDAASLLTNESGKVEAWYVVEHAPSARLYLGLLPGTNEALVRRVLDEGGDLSRHMARRAVARGDLVIVDPGIPHAIGRGITLLEPQHVAPGKRAVTYRYWDWNRLYDPRGVPSPSGAPRPLHFEQALAVTRWQAATDTSWLATRSQAFGWPELGVAARVERLCGPLEPGAQGIACEALHVARALGDGVCELPAWPRLRALTVIEGALVLGEGESALRVERGRTVALPAASGVLHARLERAHALICAAAS